MSLPIEIINHILSFRERHPIAIYMKYLIDECYGEDFDPYANEIHYFSYNYSFSEWYFLYRNHRIYNNSKKKYLLNCRRKFRCTPRQLVIGSDLFLVDYL